VYQTLRRPGSNAGFDIAKLLRSATTGDGAGGATKYATSLGA
jgi:hypothetical protein